MATVNSILDQRMKRPSHTSKMAAMAKQSAAGNLTSFSGVFNLVELDVKEKETLAEILKEYGHEERESGGDLEALISLTSEVRAIHNQAALLHGERIKKAHHILTHYREGAFTAWLVAAYGNRQTPYNLMQYYAFYESMPKPLRPRLEAMPRQAVYVLASRAASLEQKQTFVENYQGETKAEMLALIRQTFPLNHADKRGPKIGKRVIETLRQVRQELTQGSLEWRATQKQQALALLQQIRQLVEAS